MTERFDVPARLAEGREAVEHTQIYVSACRLRGYQHPDLTAHGAQVRDWYDGEDGLDLQLLDGDCAELWAVVNAAEEALRVQRTQLGELAAAWRGPGADSAVGFLHRHCDAGAAVLAGVRTAAEACGALRDNLWRLIDDKVAAAVGIDDRSCTQRPAWLAAAHSVTVGTGDRQTADDVVDRQVKPYVDNDIRIEWLTVMRSARTSVAAAYDAATAAVAPGAEGLFQVPGELGPRYQPDLAPPARAAPVAPAATAAPSIDPCSARPGPASAAGAPLDDPPVPLDDLSSAPFGDPVGLSGADLPLGAGLPTGAGNPAGLIPRIVDAIGRLLGSPDDGLTDPGLGESVDEEPDDEEPDEELEPDDEPDDKAGESEAEPEQTESPDEVAADASTDDPVAAPADQQVAPPSPDTPEEQPDVPGSTPCEIAADELPQAGQ
jgi:hypothetical protein